MTTEKSSKKADASQVRSQPAVVWVRENVRNVYANVFNVAGSPEEFVLSLGISHSWSEDQSELKVQMTDRVLMSPFTAKRLARLLNGVIREFESRYGTLQVERIQQGSPAPAKVQSQDLRVADGRASRTDGESIRTK